MTRQALALAATLALGGCALGRSPAATTWVLDPLAVQAAAGPAAEAGPLLAVERVAVPDWLDRPQLVARGASGAIAIDERARWGEPLARGLQRVIAENLAALLPGHRVATTPVPPRHAVDLRLAITILDASRQSDGSVRLEARWELTQADGTLLARDRAAKTARPAGPGARDTVAGLNEALAELATDLARAVERAIS